MKRAGGPWSLGHEAVLAALRRADAVISLNPADDAGIAPHRRGTRPAAVASSRSSTRRRSPPRPASAARTGSERFKLDPDVPWLIAVAMMRAATSSPPTACSARRWPRCRSAPGSCSWSATARRGRRSRRRWRRSARASSMPAPQPPEQMPQLLRGRRPVRLAGDQRGVRHGDPRSAGRRPARRRRPQRRRAGARGRRADRPAGDAGRSGAAFAAHVAALLDDAERRAGLRRRGARQGRRRARHRRRRRMRSTGSCSSVAKVRA